MRIDSHQHFWHYNPQEYGWIDDSMSPLRRDFLPEDLAPELARAGFDGSIAVQTRQTLEETRWLLRLAEQERAIAGVVGWVDLRSPSLNVQLEELSANRRLLGIRHIVQGEPDDFLREPRFLRGVQMLDEFGLTYDILIYTKHLPVAREFVERFPEQRFVLDHMAKPPIRRGELEGWATGIRALAESGNVMCKLSGLVTEADWENWEAAEIRPYLDVAVEAFGWERMMVGSDWPVCLVAARYSEVMELVEDYFGQSSAEVRDAVFGGNAARFWKLDRRRSGESVKLDRAEG
jgi:L-fuconolactonase